MGETAGALLSALVSDVVGIAGIPGGALLGEALKTLMKRRMDAAREILLDELKRGDKTLMDAEMEEAAAILWRYQRAAQEGAARINLRLLARVIVGQAHMGNLKADEFLYYADILAGLRREEILALGLLWNKAQEHPHPIRRQDVLIMETRDDAVPAIYPTREEYSAATVALIRTGLVKILVGGGAWGGGSSASYHFTPLMARLVALAPLDGLDG